MKILITGIAGTGKSIIAKILNERGIAAIDLHDVPGLFFWQDRETKQTVEYTPVHSKEWFDTVDRLCDIKKMKGVLARQPNTVMAGSTSGSNQKEFFSLFDKIILLQGNPETLIHRMQTRTNKSGYGKTEAEQEDNIEWQKEYDPFLILLGAIPVSTEGNLDSVVDKIIEIIKSA
jgi:broad-specificity NMP kinase